MITLLTLLSCLAVVLLLAVVAAYLLRIARLLEKIGGSATSRLGKIRFGLRAIETQTAQLAPRVNALNSGLLALDSGLRAVAADLTATARNLQGESR